MSGQGREVLEIWQMAILPCSGGRIRQSRTYMQLLTTAHLGEVSVTVWPKILKDLCAKRNIHVLE